MRTYFDHEKLQVYQEAIQFISWSSKLSSGIQNRIAAKDQLDRAATSIALNIAEGNGKFAIKDRCRYLEIARGSAFECAACLDVMVAKGIIKPEDILLGKEQLLRIVSMLVKLIQSLTNRVAEEAIGYSAALHEQEQEQEHEKENE